MAPEQWNGYPPAPASDMYSAAVVFYECLTGERPFRSNTVAEMRTLHETAPPPLDQMPPAVRGLLERGLAKYPQERYGDVRSFLADVEAAAVAGQTIDLSVGDATWVHENGRWLIGMPKNRPSVIPTDLFPSGSFPTDIFPSGSIPTDLFPSGLPTSIPSDLFSDLPTGGPTS